VAVLKLKTYIALLRGINVGGNNMLPMKELKTLLEKEGCRDVTTYIQSGNVILCSPVTAPEPLATRISAAVSKKYGFEPRVLLLTRDELQKAAKGNPFPQAADNPKSVHLFFLAAAPKAPNLKRLEEIKIESEQFALKERTFYLYTPEGFGTSKLASRVEQHLGVQATARNWRTVTTLLELSKITTKTST
jgi:uncharacterized protein (DUF1697 family)